MNVVELVHELKQSSPTTAYEYIYWLLLSLVGIVIAFKPDTIFVIEGIDYGGFLSLPNWIGLLLLLGAPNLLLLTKFVQWVSEEGRS